MFNGSIIIILPIFPAKVVETDLASIILLALSVSICFTSYAESNEYYIKLSDRLSESVVRHSIRL